jgi:phosphatidylglycerophosphate synthase
MLAGACLWVTSWEAPYSRTAWLAAAALVQARLLANLFDGMVAIERSVASLVGELYNELPDRISDAAIMVGLGYAAGGCPTLGWAAALAAVATAYVRAAVQVAGASADFCGPMAKQQRMFVVTLVALYGGLAPADWQPMLEPSDAVTANSQHIQFGLASAVLVVIVAGCIVTIARRIRRAVKEIERMQFR